MIENSVIGVRSIIGENVTIRDTYIMGIDYYEQPNQLAENQTAGPARHSASGPAR